MATPEELIEMIKEGCAAKIANKEQIPPAIFTLTEDGEIGLNNISPVNLKYTPVIVADAHDRFDTAIHVTRAIITVEDGTEAHVANMHVKNGDEEYVLYAEILKSGDWQELSSWERKEIEDIEDTPNPDKLPKLN
jgi:hypothetical protein